MQIEIWLWAAGFSLVLFLFLWKKWNITFRSSLILSVVAAFLAALTLTFLRLAVDDLTLFITIGLESILLVVFSALIILKRFFRDPERVPPEGAHHILSPADGTVRYIKKIKRGEIPFSEKKKVRFRLDDMIQTDCLREGAYLVGIEMNIMNVHVNRAPIEGQVIFQKHYRGEFLSLRNMESLIKNERFSHIIDNGHFKIGVIQIASRLVRRIVAYVKEGDFVQKGQRIGVITFGSQVDLVIPGLRNLIIHVKGGDEVFAGETIIADYEE